MLGQETTGPGGLAYALRTVPVALDIAERTRRLAPDAWFINFTNPAGIVTEAMQSVLGERVIGICDSPIALARRAIGALGLDPAATEIDYVGLNHLGWLRALRVDGADHLPAAAGRPGGLQRLEEGRLFGPEWLRTLGALPNEYLYYYYFTREAVASILEAPQTRGEFLLGQQSAFYDAVARRPRAGRRGVAPGARAARRHLHARGACRGRGARRGRRRGRRLRGRGAGHHGRDQPGRGVDDDPEHPQRGGGAGPARGRRRRDPVHRRPQGPRAATLPPVEGHQLGTMQQVKAVERAVIEAATTGSADAALRAFALHPLVDSVSTARRLLAGYRAASPRSTSLLS